ncbi:MAG: hypothetical protein BGO10_07945 [Chlamydia sp. 32-24]|nr:MAG: hypothetical protein BGO10_07945 [Chlamydia sp. 32-24]
MRTYPLFSRYILLFSSFATYSVNSLAAYPVDDNRFDCYYYEDTNTLNNITQLAKNLESSRSRSSIEYIDLMLQIKNEVEKYTGSTISIYSYLNYVSSEIESKGYEIPVKSLNTFKRLVRLREKKIQSQRADYPLSYEQNIFDVYANVGNGQQPQDNELPPSLCWGLTIALTGGFLYMIPCCQAIGQSLVGTGLGIALQTILDKQDRDYWEKRKVNN